MSDSMPAKRRNITWALFLYVLLQWPFIIVACGARFVWEGLSLGWMLGKHVQDTMEDKTP